MTAEFTPRVRKVVRERSGDVCERCEKARATDFHHRLPRKMGGTKRNIGTPANCAHLCNPCHVWAEKNRDEAYRAGWLIREGDDPPDMVPLTNTQGHLFGFTDSGGRVDYSQPLF